MQTIIIYTFLSVIAVSLVSFAGLFTLALQESLLRRYVFVLVSLATGALLGDSFIHLIPESFTELDATFAGLLVICGMLVFFILEKVLHWHHFHGQETDEEHFHDGSYVRGGGIHHVGKMVLVSDGIHNFLDGVIIAGSYFVALPVGLATTIAVILHEIPQEVGDFGVLIHSGYSKKRALYLNFLTAMLSILGALAVVFLGGVGESLIVWVIPFTAGGFIYIASSDLIPELHRVTGVKKSIAQFVAILIGILAMFLLTYAEYKEPVPDSYALEQTLTHTNR